MLTERTQKKEPREYGEEYEDGAVFYCGRGGVHRVAFYRCAAGEGWGRIGNDLRQPNVRAGMAFCEAFGQFEIQICKRRYKGFRDVEAGTGGHRGGDPPARQPVIAG